MTVTVPTLIPASYAAKAWAQNRIEKILVARSTNWFRPMTLLGHPIGKQSSHLDLQVSGGVLR